MYLATADQQSFYEHIGYNVCATGITPIRFSQNPDVSIILEKKFRYSKSPFVKSDPSGRCGNSDGLWQNSGNISEISKLGKIIVHLTSEASHQSNANISPKLSLSSERPSEQKWKNERTYSVKIIGSGEKRVFMHKKLLWVCSYLPMVRDLKSWKAHWLDCGLSRILIFNSSLNE